MKSTSTLVRTGVRAGGGSLNHAERICTNVRAGGITVNHSERVRAAASFPSPVLIRSTPRPSGASMIRCATPV